MEHPVDEYEAAAQYVIKHIKFKKKMKDEGRTILTPFVRTPMSMIKTIAKVTAR